MGAVGKDIPHDSARGHVSGESVFLDDVSPARNEVFVDCVGSPVAHGELIAVDYAEALKVPGVVAILTHEDIPGHNDIGPVVKDEHLLVSKVAHFMGDPIVLIAAENRTALLAAKQAVKVTMRELRPILSIDDAMAQNSFLGDPRVIRRGDVEQALAASPHVLEGELLIGGQEHFYLESQIAIAYPGEGGAMTVHSSTQHPTEVQSTVAEVLGVPFNHVTIICKRMGGAFGGKETQAAGPACMAAVVARRLNRPARFFISKDDDMRLTGKRHPFKSFYRAGFDDDGTINALDVRLFSDGGWSLDLSSAVLERALLHSDNAYFVPHFRAAGRICRTNLPSNTAFRGFGGPQGVCSTENVIEEIARRLGLDALEVRRRNCYGITDRNVTPYGQVVRNNTLPRLFEELARSSDYARRRQEIARFNASSRTRLRGMAMTPVKFGISFTRRTLNQANALVNIYTDGTVMVSTGGTEMGQGVNTRVRQIVADELGVSYDAVIVTATNTDKNNNTSPTAASSGTDLNGAAAVDACRKIRARLRDLAARMLGNAIDGINPEPEHIVFAGGYVWDDRVPEARITFKALVCQAYIERVNLGERGFYVTPGVDFNRDTGKGHPFFYFTNGVACSEVLIDRFTGEMRVSRVDLLMDAGEAINPGIDRGQIVGGFVQGMGWVTTEELKWSPRGELWSHSPTTYKIPNISDLPETFNVATLPNPDNAVSLYRSKALGEPPLLLGISVWAAVKDALSHAAPAGEPAHLAVPATPEQILAVLTRLTRRAAPATPAAGR
ncbi:MAG TPA: xanthine dehydrogenase molybdopterin binding subunit [Tepidisphaeraceae bacterium]|nr:xanthine dehydrogenase molybdopterin binding subunit [Tepidisphaeraceae bacterium]